MIHLKRLVMGVLLFSIIGLIGWLHTLFPWFLGSIAMTLVVLGASYVLGCFIEEINYERKKKEIGDNKK